jgi:hypothetical protein
MTTASASRRRAAKPKTVPDSGSSHWASSMMEQRTLGSPVGQQGQHTEADEIAIRRRSRDQPEGRTQRVALRWRQPVDRVWEALQDSVQRGPPDRGLLFYSHDGGRDHPSPLGQVGHRPQQGCLSDTHLTPQHEGGTVPALGVVEKRTERRELVYPVDERHMDPTMPSRSSERNRGRILERAGRLWLVEARWLGTMSRSARSDAPAGSPR